jgi:WD40 repeat protein
MALYVMNPRTFSIEKIVSTQTRGTISMSVSPHNDNLVACSGIDGSLCVWDIASESCERRLTHPADILAWDPHDASNCAIIVNSPKIQLFSWSAILNPMISLVVGIFARQSAPPNVCLLLILTLLLRMLQGY